MSTPYQYFKRLAASGWIGRKERKYGQYTQHEMKLDTEKEINDARIEQEDIRNSIDDSGSMDT